jgi:hypothetical protein
MAPPHTPLLFGGGHISQMTVATGDQPPFSSGSNPSLNAPGWRTQPGGQATSYILSFPPSSSMLIPTNAFVMTNPPLSSIFPPRGSQFHAMGNPHLGDPPMVEMFIILTMSILHVWCPYNLL